MPLGPGGSPGATFEAVPLTGSSCDRRPHNSNGIDATPDGKTLIIVQSDPGKLFTVDPETGVADEIELSGMSDVFRGDGILLDFKRLYVVKNFLNQIAVIELESDLESGKVVEAHHAAPASTSRRRSTTSRSSGCTPSMHGSRRRLLPDTTYTIVRVPKFGG